MTINEILAVIGELLPASHDVASEWETILSVFGNHADLDCLKYHISGFSQGLLAARLISTNDDRAIYELLEQMQ